jgi:hypothetical protein
MQGFSRTTVADKKELERESGRDFFPSLFVGIELDVLGNHRWRDTSACVCRF